MKTTKHLMVTEAQIDALLRGEQITVTPLPLDPSRSEIFSGAKGRFRFVEVESTSLGDGRYTMRRAC